MKDALGHGSNAHGDAYQTDHTAGVQTIGLLNGIHPNVMTLARQPGGGSVHAVTGKSPTAGFMVALDAAYERKADLGSAGGATVLKNYVNEHGAQFAQPSNYVGKWTDSATGITDLDVSENVSDRAHAMDLGRQRKQKAIWDVKADREIRLDTH